MNHAQRRERLLARMEEASIPRLLIVEPKNITYLSGFTGSAGWLLITEKKHVLLTDGRYWEQVARQSPEAELFQFSPQEHGSLATAVFSLLESGEKQLYLETDQLSLGVFRKLEAAAEEAGVDLQEVEGLVKELRECKDTEEIEALRAAAHIADRALAAALSDFGPGRRESELKANLEYQILKLGGEGTSFSTIVASGPNGSYPHAGVSQREIQEGELITIDFGALYRGYCSDMTRTIWYGELSAEHRQLLAHTREAQRLAVEAVRAGITCRELDAVARDHLSSVGLGEYFLHSLGHGVGLDIHESPGIRKTEESPLKIGQVITVEPGVYLAKETGCRVEDTVVVLKDGYDVLNQFPKQSLESTAPGLKLPAE